MEKRNVYIVVGVVLVVSILLASSNLTGNYLVNSPVGERGKCSDSDGGENINKPGIATYENREEEYKDECYAKTGKGKKKWLKEYFCLDIITSNRYYCSKGCVEDQNKVGACIK